MLAFAKNVETSPRFACRCVSSPCRYGPRRRNWRARPYRAYVAVARAIESIKPVPAQGVRTRDTHELLAVLFDATGVDPLTMDALARAIDSGVLRDAATMPDESSIDDAAPLAAVAALAAAFELTRRAALPHAPPVIRGPADVAEIAQRDLSGLRRERVLVVACDAANRPIRRIVVAQGAVDGAPIPVREILNAVLRCDGRAFALAHNHPGGSLESSDADLDASERVAAAAHVVGLRFLGHVVVAKDGWASVATCALRTPG